MVRLPLLTITSAYLVTGVNSGTMQTDFWVFNPTSDTAKWTELRHITNYQQLIPMMMDIQRLRAGMQFSFCDRDHSLYQYGRKRRVLYIYLGI